MCGFCLVAEAARNGASKLGLILCLRVRLFALSFAVSVLPLSFRRSVCLSVCLSVSASPSVCLFVSTFTHSRWTIVSNYTRKISSQTQREYSLDSPSGPRGGGGLGGRRRKGMGEVEGEGWGNYHDIVNFLGLSVECWGGGWGRRRVWGL